MNSQYKGLTVLLLAMMAAATACKKDDFLNVVAKGQVSDATVWASEGNADLFLNDIYDGLPNINQEYQLSEQYADNSFCGAAWETGQSVVRAGAISPSNVPTGPGANVGTNGGMWDWVGNYTKIRKCNTFLQKINENAANFSEDWLKKRTGEVYFLRALFYNYLLTSYGGVPIITVPLDNTSSDTLFYPRSTFDQTLAFIEHDCDSAALLLPSDVAKNLGGRPSKGSAVTLKGWVELFAASPLVNINNDLSKWAKAAATNKEVIDMNLYSLLPDYSNIWAQAYNDNDEVIFNREYVSVKKGGYREGYLGPVYVSGVQEGWGNLAPTQGLVDDYSMDNGLPITDPSSGYDDQHPYDHREKRFYQSILYDGAPWQGDTIKTRIGGSNQIDLGSTSDITNTGYYARKTIDENIKAQASIANATGGENYIYFRYAEVLLSYAEAQNEAVGPDASVYDAVNKVRIRNPAAPYLPSLPAGLSQSQMRDYIRRERRIELAFEDKRWFDIRRWNITSGSTGVLNTPEYGMEIRADATGKLNYTRVKIFTNIFYDKNNWMPIPQTVMDKNPQLKQNAGY